MSFLGIFRSKNRKNRVIYDSKPVSPNEEDICNCAPDTAEAPEVCEEAVCENADCQDNGAQDCECGCSTDD